MSAPAGPAGADIVPWRPAHQAGRPETIDTPARAQRRSAVITFDG